MSTIFIKKRNYSATKTQRPARRTAGGEDGYKLSNGVFSGYYYNNSIILVPVRPWIVRPGGLSAPSSRPRGSRQAYGRKAWCPWPRPLAQTWHARISYKS